MRRRLRDAMGPVGGASPRISSLAWLTVLVLLQIVGCGSFQDCSKPQEHVSLLHTDFAGLLPDGSASRSVQVPGNLDTTQLEVAVTWTPSDNAILLAISDHPCSADELEGGVCALAAFTGRSGSAFIYPSVKLGTSYVLYVVNLGSQAESGSIRVTALGRDVPGCQPL
jgi:hypothetical protein